MVSRELLEKAKGLLDEAFGNVKSGAWPWTELFTSDQLATIGELRMKVDWIVTWALSSGQHSPSTTPREHTAHVTELGSWPSADDVQPGGMDWWNKYVTQRRFEVMPPVAIEVGGDQSALYRFEAIEYIDRRDGKVTEEGPSIRVHVRPSGERVLSMVVHYFETVEERDREYKRIRALLMYPVQVAENVR